MRQVIRRLLYFVRQRELEADLAEEMRFHREMKQRELERDGMSQAEAALAAGREIGNVTLAREDARAVWIWPWLESVWQDLRIGMRTLAKHPGFTTVAVLTMALGIGANTAIFSLLDASLFRVLRVKDPQQLVFLYDVLPNGRTSDGFPIQTFEGLRDHNRSLSGIVAYDNSRVSVTIDGDPEMAPADFVSGSYFDVLGVSAVVGRTFTDADDGPGKEPVAVISDAYWHRRFARSAAAIGKTIYLAKIPFKIIGVTSADFHGRRVTGSGAYIVLPMSVHSQLALRDHTAVSIMARLKPGVTVEQAAGELTVTYRQILAEAAGLPLSPQAEQDIRRRSLQPKSGLRGEHPGLRPNDTKQVRMVTAVVGLVLLIACFNVANLLVARAAARQKEIAVRLSIGASRRRLIRQLLTESVLLAVLGGACGLIFAKWGAEVLGKVLPFDGLPFDPRQDVAVLAFTAVVSILTGILFGLAPALTATRVDLNPVLQGNDGGADARRRRHRLAKSLVIAQVALSLALLIGAGLLIRSVARLLEVEPGFDAGKVLAMDAYPVLLGYDRPAELRFYQDVLDRLNATPGVRSASLSRLRITKGGYNLIAPRYFETLGVTLVRGRDFSFADTSASPKVAIISESTARESFPDEEPIGKRLPVRFERIFGGSAEIVGVAKDLKRSVWQLGGDVTVYAPYTQAPPERLGQVDLFVRAAGDPIDLIPLVRQQIQSVERHLALVDIHLLTDEVQRPIESERSTAILLSCFGAIALALASIGLYGTMAYAVGRRTREIGIRVALGARSGDMLWMVLRETLSLALAGVAIGVPVALAGTRLLSSMLFGVASTDVLTFSSVITVMLTVSVMAGYIPARRAAHVDPMIALRYE